MLEGIGLSLYFAPTKISIMALSLTNTVTEQPLPASPAAEPALSTSDAAALLTIALAGAAATKASKRYYRKMARKAAWKMMGMKMKAALGFKQDVPDTVMGLNFWLFLGIVVAASILGVVLFGVLGFIIVLGIAFIIYLLLNDK
jgi:hypothetical protein